MYRTTLLIISLLIYQNSFSQYTDIINSNRPGNSSGAFSVGKNILQIESGFFNVKEKHDLLNYETKGFGIDFKIRYGFLYEKLELVINGVYQSDEFSDLRYNPVNSYDRKNFKKFQVGAKYLIFDPKKGQEDEPNVYSYWADRRFNLKNLIPAVSAYVGVNIDSKDNPFTSSGVNGIHFILGFSNDKNIEKISNIFPKDGSYYFVKPNVGRGMNANEVKKIFFKNNRVGKSFRSSKEALSEAYRYAKQNDFVFIGGSTFVVSEVI